ncbi:Protein FAR1-RELATED SEQUENCE [Abeliophyllum distichum]|uniref:Protein FAR1-RELATED SEQUENCE n=1 Tax=Abeliophyllum distichum TaxID=126358 RepID=A0ABD1VP79_9LAMI
MEIDFGSPSSVRCVERDLRNHERYMREEQKEHDADTLIENFTLEKEKSPIFYFITSLIRIISCSDVFGLTPSQEDDIIICVVIDEVPGIHVQCTAPLIITDQDAAIVKDISIVMPVIFHRFCIWHLLNKFSEKINAMLYNEQYHRLVHIIKDSETPKEFEQRCNTAMDTTDLHCNEWLRTMYGLRTRWVPAYVNHIFNAGMSSSQRVESGHSFFKKHILHRWTKNAKVGSIYDTNYVFSNDHGPDKSLKTQHRLMAHKASMFEHLHLRAEEIDIQGNNVNPHSSSKSREPQVVEDPSEARAKGYGKRLKSSKEKAISRCNQQCSVCGAAGHDKSTC